MTAERLRMSQLPQPRTRKLLTARKQTLHLPSPEIKHSRGDDGCETFSGPSPLDHQVPSAACVCLVSGSEAVGSQRSGDEVMHDGTSR